MPWLPYDPRRVAVHKGESTAPCCPATCDACADNAKLGVCEDSADEVVAKISEEALGRPVSSCVEVMALGACSHAMAKTHCPATCGLCDTSCEDSADEVVQQLSQEALGRPLSCGGLKDIVGACHRAIVMKHCPASCGLCEDPEYLERHLELANMYGEMNHRQLKKIC